MIDRYIQHGRTCLRCGEQNYPLSTSGPDYCPACACGNDTGRIKVMRAEIDRLKTLLKKHGIDYYDT